MPCRLAVLVAALAAFACPAAAAEPPKRLLLVGSDNDRHPPKTHEYMAGVDLLAKLLKPVPGLEVTVAKADAAWKDGPELLGRADGAFLYLTEGARWLSADAARLAAFRKLAARGGGLSVLHWGMGTQAAEPVEAFVGLFGGCHGGPDRKYKIAHATFSPAEPRHPIAAGIEAFTVREEFYYRLKFAGPEGAAKPVLAVAVDGKPETVAWAWERPDGGRSFGFTGLHYHENWKRPECRRAVVQGALWTVKLPVPEGGANVDLDEAAYALPRR